MNNDDERDYAEEQYNKSLLKDELEKPLKKYLVTAHIEFDAEDRDHAAEQFYDILSSGGYEEVFKWDDETGSWK